MYILNTVPLFGVFQVTGFLLSFLCLFLFLLKNKNYSIINFAYYYLFILLIGFISGNIFSNIVYFTYSDHWIKDTQSILGSFLGVYLLFSYFILKKSEKNLLKFDIIFLCFPIFQITGKIGCFFGGCCGGKIPFLPFIPLQLLEAFLILVSYLILLINLKKMRKYKGLLFPAYLFMYSIIRIFSEFFRVEPTATFYNIRIPQLAAILLLFLSLIIYRLIITENKKN